MAGGVIVAGELWIPGQKLISIASGKVFTGSLWEITGQGNIRYIGGETTTTTVSDFYKWLWINAQDALEGHAGGAMNTSALSLLEGYRVENPEHLVNGSLCQDAADEHCSPGLREQWNCANDMTGADLMVDKVYYTRATPLRARITELDNGYVGVR
jgi:hypothetical protein